MVSPSNEIPPSYLGLLTSGELQRRVEALEAMLESCTVCPLDCGNNRLRDELARCYSGRLPIVSSYTPHFGEEPPLTGTRCAVVPRSALRWENFTTAASRIFPAAVG